MSYTTDDINHRCNDEVNRVADEIKRGVNPYNAAAYSGPPKAESPTYALEVGAVIAREIRIISIRNQGLLEESSHNKNDANIWLNDNNTYWVICDTNNMPYSTPYRVYVCARLTVAHIVLRQLLERYNRPVYFKVATHKEAQIRNDTIVSWHQNLADAHQWAQIAQLNLHLLEGNAPAGTFGSIKTHSVGIDINHYGITSTEKISQAGIALAIKRNPYI